MKKSSQANQHNPDPRQHLFLENYLNTSSPTFSNALQSALKAGYKQEYAENILNIMPTWLSETLDSLVDKCFLKDIDDELQKIAKMETISHVKVGDEVVVKQDPQLLKIKQDTLKFLAERLNKAKYSTRQEITGKDGKDLPTPIISIER